MDSQVALNLDQAAGDARYYLNTTTLDSIAAPTTTLSMNSHRITALAAPVDDSDALNRITADGRYYQATTTLDGVLAPTANVDLNAYKIVNIAPAVTHADVPQWGQDLRWQWVDASFSADISSGFSNPMVMQFDTIKIG